MTAVALIVGAALVAGCGGDDEQVALPVVRIFGPYRGEEAALLTAGLDEWADAAGIDVRYTGSANFVADLQYQVVETLSPPDNALVPQPGLVREMFLGGHVVPVSDDTAEMLSGSYDDVALDLGRVDGTLVGFPYRTNVKSLVWYRPGVLTDLGFTPPDTMVELESLVDLIQERGLTPWCLGIESQLATGWPATDWVEDLILRQVGSGVYLDWVAGDVPFSDERIANAFGTFRALVLEPGRVAGGVSRVLGTGTQMTDDPLFSDPPGCVFFKQASFAYGWKLSCSTAPTPCLPRSAPHCSGRRSPPGSPARSAMNSSSTSPQLEYDRFTPARKRAVRWLGSLGKARHQTPEVLAGWSIAAE